MCGLQVRVLFDLVGFFVGQEWETGLQSDSLVGRQIIDFNKEVGCRNCSLAHLSW